MGWAFATGCHRWPRWQAFPGRVLICNLTLPLRLFLSPTQQELPLCLSRNPNSNNNLNPPSVWSLARWSQVSPSITFLYTSSKIPPSPPWLYSSLGNCFIRFDIRTESSLNIWETLSCFMMDFLPVVYPWKTHLSGYLVASKRTQLQIILIANVRSLHSFVQFTDNLLLFVVAFAILCKLWVYL